MKCRWDLTVDNTKQILGGYLETTEAMTEKQMMTYVRRICREYLLNNKEIKRYGIWVEVEDSDEYSYHIETQRTPGGYIDTKVYDAEKKEFIVDTYGDRLERQRIKYEEDMLKFEESLQTIS